MAGGCADANLRFFVAATQTDVESGVAAICALLEENAPAWGIDARIEEAVRTLGACDGSGPIALLAAASGTRGEGWSG